VTPAIEALRAAAVDFRLHEYEGVELGEGDYAVAVATALGIEPERLFKTLLASIDGKLLVFVIPADRQLDLRAVGKRAVMAERAAAERATGYIAGGTARSVSAAASRRRSTSPRSRTRRSSSARAAVASRLSSIRASWFG
jgi:prolyl-tRNA editing enzyme YbaK/EbsC (Cys-tRNA(Pro) deacylase)